MFLPGDPFNPLIVHGLMNFPASHPQNPFGVDRTLGLLPNELGGRDQTTDNTVIRLITGLQGTAYGWDYDAALGYIHSKLKDSQTGFINYDIMQAAVNNGTYLLSGLGPSRTSPAVLAAISPTLEITPTSSVKLIDFKASRDVMKLAGGSLGVAVGAEAREEQATRRPCRAPIPARSRVSASRSLPPSAGSMPCTAN